MNDQNEHFDKVVRMQKGVTNEAVQYWHVYSDYGNWQFWVVLLLMIVPLVLIYFVIDRKNVFKIGFFGFAVHVLFFYTDALGIRTGLWAYRYHITPYLPSLSLDSALIPVVSMLVFQWTLKNDKNFYIYALITALVFGFGFKPLLVSMDFFEMYKGVNYFYIFLIYIVVFLLAYWLTRLFSRMHKQAPTQDNGR
ncbi:hypothetical protein JOC77_001084 [Peribacillus deserti]|uniref:Uncharacterized protein n=1 Tax=Peribacillus deserti TaxID=673318 RepID=A0ABS2QF06_9BACI|nr:CBO0543 family protein [Peribacillus deserti]MBM7691677.1 hypothetical protein [Peribacillus deserti]